MLSYCMIAGRVVTLAALASLLAACGSGDDEPLVPPAAALAGTYDVEFMPDVPANEASGIGRVTSDGANEITVNLFLPYTSGLAASVSLSGTLDPDDGTLTLHGFGLVEDIGIDVDGQARVEQAGDEQRIAGRLTTFFDERLDFTMRRSTDGVRRDLGGRYRVEFPESPAACGCASEMDLAIEIFSDGRCEVAPTLDVALDGEILAEVHALSCLVTPRGRVYLDLDYDDDTGRACAGFQFGANPDFPCPLILTGRLRIRGVVREGRGRFTMIETNGFAAPVNFGAWRGVTVQDPGH